MIHFPNWRHVVLHTLLVAGALSVILIFSEDGRDLGRWIEVRIWLAATAVMIFGIMHRLTRRWERNGKIEKPYN